MTSFGSFARPLALGRVGSLAQSRGDAVRAPKHRGGYGSMSGASMASAEIAELAALLAEAGPLRAAREARAAIATRGRGDGAATAFSEAS